jgi:hypothetical protein
MKKKVQRKDLEIELLEKKVQRKDLEIELLEKRKNAKVYICDVYYFHLLNFFFFFHSILFKFEFACKLVTV